FASLREPLCVGVANGRCPVANASVLFEIAKGQGRLKATPNSPPAQVVSVLTDANGIACVFWELDSTNVTQQVMARLLDAAGNPMHLPVRFTANLQERGGGCEITVGEGGQYGTLEKAVEALR